MNRLVRGLTRSGCRPRVGSGTTSLAAKSTASVSVVGAHNHYHYSFARHTYADINDDSQTYYAATAHFAGIISYRNFSSMNAVPATAPAPDSAAVEQTSETTNYRQRPPSALEKANLKEITPGHALSVLHQFAAGGGALIRQSDFVQLCESSRPGKKKDAKVIATAMREFKRNNKFILQRKGARAAVVGMLRSMTPTWKIQDGKPKVQAAVFAAEQILDDRSGLFFACETIMVDKVLEELHVGLLEMEENGFNLKVDNFGQGGEADEEGREQSDEQKLMTDALRVTEGVVKLLIKRKSRPELKMKKRAKRKYLKHLQTGAGPNTRSTLKLATQISILLGGSTAAKENIIAPYEEKIKWVYKPVRPETLQLIDEAKALELEAQKEAEAANAADEEVEDDIADDGDESNAGGSDGDDGDIEQDDEQNQAESEEEEKP